MAAMENDPEVVIVVDDDDNNKKTFTDLTCPICFELIWSDTVGVTDPCGHMFHQSCWNSWDERSSGRNNKTKCPMCQTKVTKLINVFGLNYSSGTSYGGATTNRVECTNNGALKKAEKQILELEANIVQIEEEKTSLNECLKRAEGEVERLKLNIFQLSMCETKWKSHLERAEKKIGALQCDIKLKDEKMAQMVLKLEESRCSPEMLQLQKKYVKAQAELVRVREDNRTLQEQLDVFVMNHDHHRRRTTGTGTTSTNKTTTVKPLSSKERGSTTTSNNEAMMTSTTTITHEAYNNSRTTSAAVAFAPNHRKVQHEILENTVLGSVLKVRPSSSNKPPIGNTVKKTCSTALDALTYSNNSNKRKKSGELVPTLPQSQISNNNNTNSTCTNVPISKSSITSTTMKRWYGKENIEAKEGYQVLSNSFIHISKNDVKHLKRTN